jgi:hypothetical protein
VGAAGRIFVNGCWYGILHKERKQTTSP